MAYATNAELLARYPGLSTQDTNETAAELDAASAWVDGHCNRTFSPEAEATVRYFSASDYYVLDLGPFEISTTDGVIIATDDGSGTYATTVSAGGYQLEPVNAAFASPDPRPFTTIRRLSSNWPMATLDSERQERVKVTAKYGWPAVPEAIKRATLALVNASFENPSGVRSEAIDGYSVTYMSAAGVEVGVPPSVVRMLSKYQRGWAA